MQNDKESDDNTKRRFDFHEAVSRRLGLLCLVMAIGVVGEVWKEVWDHMHPPAPNVIGLYPNGQLQKAVVLSQPMIDDIAMKDWVEKAILKTCNLNFMDWQDQLNNAAEDLLPAAVDGLKAEMESKNITKELKSDRLMEWCSVGGASWIAQKGLVNNALYYEVKLPLMVRFMGQNEGRDHSSKQMMRVVVLQVDRSVKPRGFGIASIQAEPQKAPIDGTPQ